MIAFWFASIFTFYFKHKGKYLGLKDYKLKLTEKNDALRLSLKKSGTVNEDFLVIMTKKYQKYDPETDESTEEVEQKNQEKDRRVLEIDSEDTLIISKPSDVESQRFLIRLIESTDQKGKDAPKTTNSSFMYKILTGFHDCVAVEKNMFIKEPCEENNSRQEFEI